MFYVAGYGEQQVLEVLLGLSQKILAIIQIISLVPAVDVPFQKYALENK